MAQAIFVQSNLTIDYTAGTAVAAGEVVIQGELVAIAKRPIAAGETGTLELAGIFDVAKGAGVSIAVGTFLYWDNLAKVATPNAPGNKLLGKSVRAAAAADATVRVAFG